MKINTKSIIFALALLASCKPLEPINPNDYPNVITGREVQYYNSGTHIIFNDGEEYLEVELVPTNPDSVLVFLVENSEWEAGNDVLEISKNKTGLQSVEYRVDYLINKDDLTFDELINGNYHIEVRDLTNSYLLTQFNCGKNSNDNQVSYFISDSLLEIRFKEIVNGSYCMFGCNFEDTTYILAVHKILVELVAGTVDNPKEIIRTSMEYEDNGSRLFTYTINEIKNLDAHIRVISKEDSSIIFQGNIGKNAP